MICPLTTFGHSAANHGRGCSGCDAEHGRVTDKLLGPVPLQFAGRVTGIDLDGYGSGTPAARIVIDIDLADLNQLGAAMLDKREVFVTVPRPTHPTGGK